MGVIFINSINITPPDSIDSSFVSANEHQTLDFKSLRAWEMVSRFARIYGHSQISLASHVRIDDFSFVVGGKELRSQLHSCCALCLPEQWRYDYDGRLHGVLLAFFPLLGH